MKQKTTLGFPEYLYEELGNVAKKLGVSKSQLICILLYEEMRNKKASHYTSDNSKVVYKDLVRISVNLNGTFWEEWRNFVEQINLAIQDQGGKYKISAREYAIYSVRVGLDNVKAELNLEEMVQTMSLQLGIDKKTIVNFYTYSILRNIVE